MTKSIKDFDMNDTGDHISNENEDWLNQLIINQTVKAYKMIRYDILNIADAELFKNATGGSTIGAAKIWINESNQIEKIKSGLELLDKRVKPAQAYYMLKQV